MKAPRRPFLFGPTPEIASRRWRRNTAGAVQTLFNTGFSRSKKLSMHMSCVNCLALSSGDGRFLASGGDDPFVYIWDLHQDDLTTPTCGFLGSKGNIFSLAFSATNKYIYSGDTDHQICMFDMSRIDELTNRPGDALRTFNRHNSNIRALSCHPENENLLLSASEDGTIKMHDTRVGGHDAQGVLTMAADFTSVQYHPTTPNLFVTGTNTGGVCLRDVRNSFGHGDARVPVATTYVTSLSKSCLPTLYMPEIGSVTFDKTGDKLAVTMLCHQPTIYSLRDPLPLATCSGLNAPNGTPVPPSERTYSNCCTIKHGSFGGAGLPNDSYYSAGSDDFRAYVWKIPELGELTQRREVIAYERWQNLQHALNEDEDGKQRQPLTGFTPRSFKERYVPVELSTPAFRLGGHKSIVNSALIHPTQPLIFTSGVERDILMHSPRPSAPCVSSFEDTPDKVRALPGSPTDGRGMVVRALLAEAEDTGEDRFTIALFDRIIREEGGQDLFSLPDRIWEPSEDEEPDDDDDLYI